MSSPAISAFPLQAQEALLPQTDRATRCVSQKLVNCCATVGTSCTANPQEIEIMKLEHYA